MSSTIRHPTLATATLSLGFFRSTRNHPIRPESAGAATLPIGNDILEQDHQHLLLENAQPLPEVFPITTLCMLGFGGLSRLKSLLEQILPDVCLWFE
jgi:hypothetical protein